MLVAEQRSDEQEMLLQSQLKRALLQLNEWMTKEQAERVVFRLEHIDAMGMDRNQAVHEYLTYGMPLDVDASHRRTPEGRPQ